MTLSNTEETRAMKGNVPTGYHSIAPYFTVCNADRLIEFLVAAFDAALILEKRYSTGTIQHARVRVGDSVVMLNEATDEYPANVSQLYLYVDNVNARFSKALNIGATALMEPNKRAHGDRLAGFKDPCGNVWWIATVQ